MKDLVIVLIWGLGSAGCLLLSYLISAIPCGYLIGKALGGGTDVRLAGSGNVGATNVTRTVGKKAGILTLVCDVLKALVGVGVSCLLLSRIWGPCIFFLGEYTDWICALSYLAAVLGHMFSPFLRFKGGKGIAVGFGGALPFMPLAGLALWIPFLVCAFATRRVSVGSIVAALCLPGIAWLIYRPTGLFVAVLCVVALLVVFAHRSNIHKLLRGEEKPFSFGKNKAAEQGQDTVHEAEQDKA